MEPTAVRQSAQFKQNIHLKIGEFVVSETKIEFVDSQALTINLPTVGAPMAVRAEGDEVVILMRLTLRPRDNVVNIDLDVTASGDCAAVPGLYKDAPFDISRYCGAVLHQAED